MIVIIDERELVKDGYNSLFSREGYSTTGFLPDEFHDWVETADEDDLKSVGACLIGEVNDEQLSPTIIREKTGAPVIALVDQGSLDATLKLFEQGVDDVVRKPVHVRELLARITAIRRRAVASDDATVLGRLKIYSTGRDPEIDGSPFPLPRRERRILEFLASIGERRATKSQIFSAIYGVFEADVEENVVESHISKLRKKLREALGFDPIDSKRFLGYRLVTLG